MGSPRWTSGDGRKSAHEADGERVARSTRTWSPTSRVLAIEEEGMTKFWKMKVRAKRAMTMVQREARPSRRVSSFCGCGAALLIVTLRRREKFISGVLTRRV